MRATGTAGRRRCNAWSRHSRTARARYNRKTRATSGPEDWQAEPEHELSAPGAYPYTRGVHPTMYRGKLWTMRQYAGFGTAEETNARFRHLLAAGQTGLSVAFDLPTQMGYDSDHPMAEGEVGRAGVAIDTVDDLARLFHGIPLDRVSTSMTINATAPRLSFFFAAFTDLFEEVAKFRAARRLWARLMKEQFGAGDAACRLRFHTQTGGSTLTAQQPQNNVVRVAIQALAAVLGGTQSLHTNAYDEALALPTAQSATLALRTQQILAHETGVPDVVDPAGGSWYVEALTDRIEREARALLDEVERAGGAARAIERGVFQQAIARSAYEQQKAIESGGAVVVGVNEYTDEQPIPTVPAPDYSALAAAQRQRLVELRGKRDRGRVKGALRDLEAAARDGAAPLMEPIIVAVRARATVGEISDVLRGVWGVYRPG